jgi:hypothetical protein
MSMFILCLCCPIQVMTLRQAEASKETTKMYIFRLIVNGNRPDDLILVYQLKKRVSHFGK